MPQAFAAFSLYVVTESTDELTMRKLGIANPKYGELLHLESVGATTKSERANL